MHDDPRSPADFAVLVVEDQPDVALSLRIFIELACGYRVTVAHDGQAGIDAALRDRPDAILCDIGLPKKDGFAVAAEVTRALPDKPLLIAVSGYAEDEYVARARRAGYDDYLVKPADPNDLVRLLRARAGR
jgi:DNA-binding response OmpR family regulator